MIRMMGVQRRLSNQDAAPVSAAVLVGSMRTARPRRGSRSAARPLLVMVILAAVAHPQAPLKIAVVDYRYFPGLATMDGNWAALKAEATARSMSDLPVMDALATWFITIQKKIEWSTWAI